MRGAAASTLSHSSSSAGVPHHEDVLGDDLCLLPCAQPHAAPAVAQRHSNGLLGVSLPNNVLAQGLHHLPWRQVHGLHPGLGALCQGRRRGQAAAAVGPAAAATVQHWGDGSAAKGTQLRGRAKGAIAGGQKALHTGSVHSVYGPGLYVLGQQIRNPGPRKERYAKG